MLTPALRIIHRGIVSFLLGQAGLKRCAADTGAVTLNQRFGSVANLNIRLHCLVADRVYRSAGDEVVFQETRAPTTTAELKDLPVKTISRIMSMLNPLRTDKVIGCLLKVSMTAVGR